MDADGRLVKALIPIAVGERSIAFPRRSVKVGVNERITSAPIPASG